MEHYGLFNIPFPISSLKNHNGGCRAVENIFGDHTMEMDHIQKNRDFLKTPSRTSRSAELMALKCYFGYPPVN